MAPVALTQLAVSIQGYLALDIIRRNNLELIRGVQRATTTTVVALRTAGIVAQALADQRLVLDQITALNTTASNLIAATGQLHRQQSTDVNTRAASSTDDIATLHGAFRNIYATMDEIDSFRVGSLEFDAEDGRCPVQRDHEVAGVPRSCPCA